MNPIIHGAIGWLTAQPLAKKRDRVVVTLTAVVPDLDGLGILVSDHWYTELHHRLSHGVLAAVVIPVVAGLWCRSTRVALLALIAFHTHIVTDLMGSGPGWPIWYFWPFSDVEWLPGWQWDLASWQNTTIGFGVILCCLACARFFGRTPVELFHARAERAVVETVRRRIGVSEVALRARKP